MSAAHTASGLSNAPGRSDGNSRGNASYRQIPRAGPHPGGATAAGPGAVANLFLSTVASSARSQPGSAVKACQASFKLHLVRSPRGSGGELSSNARTATFSPAAASWRAISKGDHAAKTIAAKAVRTHGLDAAHFLEVTRGHRFDGVEGLGRGDKTIGRLVRPEGLPRACDR